jgi:hypothetical protein
MQTSDNFETLINRVKQEKHVVRPFKLLTELLGKAETARFQTSPSTIHLALSDSGAARILTEISQPHSYTKHK